MLSICRDLRRLGSGQGEARSAAVEAAVAASTGGSDVKPSAMKAKRAAVIKSAAANANIRMVFIWNFLD
jgi:hypothetical protein